MQTTHNHHNHSLKALREVMPIARSRATYARNGRHGAVRAGKATTATGPRVRSHRERGVLSAITAQTRYHALAPDIRRGNEDARSGHIDAANGRDGLPLVAANRFMIRARRLAEAGDLAKARAAMQAAEDNLVFNSVYAMDPLCEAEESLHGAVCRHERGAFAAAKTELQRAIGCLDYATNDLDAVTSVLVARLRDQAAKIEGKIGLDRCRVARGLADLHVRTNALRERSIEMFATDFDRRHDGGAFKADLIEAKLHIAFAEADRWIRRRSRTATAELRIADRHLARAQAGTGGAVRARINAQRLAVKRLTEREKTNRATFVHLRRALRTLMMT